MATIRGLSRRSCLKNIGYGLRTFCRMKVNLTERNIRKFSDAAPSLQSSEGINITDSCATQLRKILDKDEFLRILIEGGGCSGYQYKFEIDNNLEDDDRMFEKDGGRVVVDEGSLALVEGCAVDYQIEMIKSGFAVKKNPKAGKGCSCGSSFSVKL